MHCLSVCLWYMVFLYTPIGFVCIDSEHMSKCMATEEFVCGVFVFSVHACLCVDILLCLCVHIL